MSIKMIVTDLDGTLLHTDKTISQYSVSVFQKCRQKGIKTIFATGRPMRLVKIYLEQICTDAQIYHNGGIVFLEGKKLYDESIIYTEVESVLADIMKIIPTAKLSVEIEDELYANFDILKYWGYSEAVMTDYTDLPNKPIYKILVVFSTMQEVNEIAKILPNDLYIEIANNKMGIIMCKKAIKLNGIKAISNIWNIPISDIAAFGDDYNDVKMVKECGIGVAMENSICEVKAVANYITDSNDNDGVAKFIDSNLL